MKLDDAFGIHPLALQLRGRRSEVLAANLANADTPGYKARDFDFAVVLKNQVPTTRLTTTRQGHIQPERGLLPLSEVKYRWPMAPSLDGNTVDAQVEYSNFASNALEYQASLRFLNGKIQGLLLAIKGQ
jgi:flagellar basal-body rod protein FlgB